MRITRSFAHIYYSILFLGYNRAYLKKRGVDIMKEKPLGITNYKYMLAAQATGVQQEIGNYFLSCKEKN